MNTRQLILGVALAFGMGSSVTAAAESVVIGFEELGNVGNFGPAVTNQYPGVVFSSNPGFENHVTSQSGLGHGLNFICTGSTFLDCVHDTTLTFTNPVNNLSFWAVGDNNSGVVALVTLLSYDMVITVNVFGDANPDTPSFVDLTAYGNITSVWIHDITDLVGLGWDDFAFDTNVAGVPEPGGLLLLAFGLGCLGLLLTRNRRARS